jgi:hypothetical protein
MLVRAVVFTTTLLPAGVGKELCEIESAPNTLSGRKGLVTMPWSL